MEKLSYQSDKIIFCKLANCLIAAYNEYAKLHKIGRESITIAIMANGIADTMAFLTHTDKIAEYICDFAKNGEFIVYEAPNLDIIYETPNLDTEIIKTKRQIMYSVEDIFDYFYFHH